MEVKRIWYFKNGLIRGAVVSNPEKPNNTIEFELLKGFETFPKQDIFKTIEIKKMAAEKIKTMEEIPDGKKKKYLKILAQG